MPSNVNLFSLNNSPLFPAPAGPLKTMRKLILLNGPPRCGKDTACDYIVDSCSGYPFKFSAPIKAAIRAAFDLCDDEVDYVESIKSEVTSLFCGRSYRATQISFSEDWAKPFFGKDFFGHCAARHLVNAIRQHPEQRLYVCSDSGFAIEALPVIDVFGTANVLLVRVEREGTSFEGDSRSYIDLPGINTISLKNNDTLEEYYRAIDCLVASFT